MGFNVKDANKNGLIVSICEYLDIYHLSLPGNLS